MTPARERQVRRGLWALYAVLAATGLVLLAEALFVTRPPRPFELRLPAAEEASARGTLPDGGRGLAGRRFTRRLAAAAQPSPAGQRPPELSLDRLIKLTGILDFGGRQPTLAVIETPLESKAYKAGDRVGETGVVVKDVKEFVIVEYEKRRYKVTYLGIQELPAAALGKE